MARDSRTRYVILGLLASGPQTGYDIRKLVAERIGHFWRESFGQIYPALTRLCAEGLARRTAKPNGGRERFVYRITPKGTAALRDWLVVPPAPVVPRQELLLKLYFGRKVGPRALAPLVAAFRDDQARQAELFAGFEADLPAAFPDDPDLPYWQIALSSGLHITRARLAWADETIATLNEWSRGARRGARRSTRTR